MQINNIQVVDRHARPAVLSKVALRTFFINDGDFADPYAISSVSIYHKAANQAPSGIFETSSGVISSGHYTDALIVFAPSAATSPSDAGPHNNAMRERGAKVFIDGILTESYKERNFTGEISDHYGSPADSDPARGKGAASGVSGVYRLGAGEYAVVLGPGFSGCLHTGANTENKASSTGDYIDVWTVKLTETSDWTTYINSFTLYNDTFYNITEPLLLRTTNRLTNKHITLGSKIDLKITTDMTVENRSIDQNIKNLVKDIGLKEIGVKIEKVNEGSNLPARVTVSSFDDTGAFVDVTADNTLVFNWDTQQIANLSNNTVEKQKREDIGSPKGTYYITAQYTVLNQKIISSPMPVIVT